MTSTSERRFVVLKHETAPHHFDVMLEAGDGLWTWSCYRTDFPEDFDRLSVERLPDHRKAYLTYEGPVSGDRGTVERVEEGTWTCASTPAPEQRIEGTFSGTAWTFPFRLTRTDRTGRRDNPIWTLQNRTRSEPDPQEN